VGDALASVDAISEMESSTSEMLGLIDVIHDVTGQTNLLSLNAAIEAARAGEANRAAVDLFEKTAEEIGILAGAISEVVSGLAEQLVATQEILRAEQVIDELADQTTGQADAVQKLLTSIRDGMGRLSANSTTTLDRIGRVAAQLELARSVHAGASRERPGAGRSSGSLQRAGVARSSASSRR
jgi:methyl-accepting chemotaxis protein